MNRTFSRASGVLFALMALACAAQAQQAPEQLIDLQASGARVFSALRGQSLGAPAASPLEAVNGFLRSRGMAQATIDSLVSTSENRATTGLSHVRLQQVVQGLTVYGTYVKATVNGRGELVHLIELLATPPGQLVRSNVAPRDALVAAASAVFPGQSFSFRDAGASGNTSAFDGGAFFFRNPTATRVALPIAGGAMQEGWLVEVWSAEDNQLFHVAVGNGARILNIESRTANESYTVFTEHPVINLGGGNIGSPEATIAGPSASAAAPSPAGWISNDGRTGGAQAYFRLSGNNVDAYLDRDNNNQPDASGTAITNGQFTQAASLTTDPTTPNNQRVAIQNLFYSNNVIHDKLYSHGFTEGAGNFQQNNFGKGGAANDSVLAEAQDGGGTSNANFSTPSDGSNPRMQMYLWSQTSPYRDGDVDSDVVFHEYGHGLTWRMIGSMSGCMSGAIGEGASDTVAILMNNDDVVGEYSYNNVNGIRRWPYTNYPLTYGDLTTEGVHAGGELFGAIMWRAKSLLNNDTALWNYFVQGMNYIAAGPRFEDMRDGIVSAAGGTSGGANSDGCKVYQAFADFGVGYGASGSCTQKGFLFPRTTWTVSESTQTLPDCAGTPTPVTDLAISIGGPSSVTTGSTTTIPVTLQNVGNQPVGTSVSVSLTTNNGTVGNSPQSVSAPGPGNSTVINFSWTPGPAGSATLTAQHSLSDNNLANNSALNTVAVNDPAAITLTVTRVVDKKVRHADLSWFGATATNIDVFLDGGKIATVPNSGAYRDENLSKGQTYTYKVCEAGSTTACSDSVSVTI